MPSRRLARRPCLTELLPLLTLILQKFRNIMTGKCNHKEPGRVTLSKGPPRSAYLGDLEEIMSTLRDRKLWLCSSMSLGIGSPQSHSVVRVPCASLSLDHIFIILPFSFHAAVTLQAWLPKKCLLINTSQRLTVALGQRKQYHSNCLFASSTQE